MPHQKVLVTEIHYINWATLNCGVLRDSSVRLGFPYKKLFNFFSYT